MLKIALLCLFSAACYGKSYTFRPELGKPTCDNMYCAIGQECVIKSGTPECECIENCIESNSPVCGSNGTHVMTYESECHLYRSACLNRENETITVVASTSCENEKENEKVLTEKIEKDEGKVKPVVCMQKDRDTLRKSVIEWITKKLGMGFEDLSYKGLLMKYFNSLDTNDDGGLDTLEFMKISEGDQTISESLSEDPNSNAILRGLCMSEIIAVTDYNSDYKLEFEEFHECLNPSFSPAKEFCESDGKKYDDGDDIPNGCNTCKCACGHWVCTHVKCDKNNNSVREKLE